MQEEIQDEFHQKDLDLQNEFNKNLLQKNEEKSHLKYLNQKIEGENQNIHKKLLENIEENNHLKKRKQDLIYHIPNLNMMRKHKMKFEGILRMITIC